MAQYTQINPDALVTALTPINNSLGGKQDKTDNTLTTTDKTISGAINEINTKVGNLTGALTWKGKFDTLPAVTNYEAGNVVGVGNKEYVLTVTGSTKAWEELGDEGSYLLKSVAEETYLKKADGVVTIANIADGAVTSTKLATGARKPIILTPNTTEVDEETYQKLLSDDVDVVFKTNDNTLLSLLSKEEASLNGKDALMFIFTGVFGSDTSIADEYSVTTGTAIIVKESPHIVSAEFVSIDLDSIIRDSGYIHETKLSPVLQEIDLTGTDADRKAKLDQFARNWKTLTGATDMTGARFACHMTTTTGDGYAILVYDNVDGAYIGVVIDDSSKSYIVQVIEFSGSIYVAPIGGNTETDTSMSDTSTNPVQNKVIKAYIDGLVGNVEAQLAAI